MSDLSNQAQKLLVRFSEAVNRMRSAHSKYDNKMSVWADDLYAVEAVMSFLETIRDAPAQGEPISEFNCQTCERECDGPDGGYRCPVDQLRKAIEDIDISAYNAAKYRIGIAIAALDSSPRSGQMTAGICCYCDAPISCAACGREQPGDSSATSPGATDGKIIPTADQAAWAVNGAHDFAERLRGECPSAHPPGGSAPCPRCHYNAGPEGAERYWEARWRDEKAENDRLASLVEQSRTSTEEMENYRMALAYISRQSTDPESRELAETALGAYPSTSCTQEDGGERT